MTTEHEGTNELRGCTMRASRLVCLVVLLLGLTSCGGTVTFTKAGTSNKQQLSDNLSCGATQTKDGALSISHAALPSYTSCMQSKGYHRVAANSSRKAGQFLTQFVNAIDAESGGPFQPAASPAHASVDAAGLAPVGPVHAPGCAGIEIVGYANDLGNPQNSQGIIQNRYFVAVRNNSRESKIVSLQVIRRQRSWQRNRSPIISKIVRAGDLVSIFIDYSPVRPISVTVKKCM